MQIDLAFLEQALNAAFPDLAPIQPLRILGSGFSSTVLEAKGTVFRVAAAIEAWWRDFLDDSSWWWEPARLCHGNFGYENLLVDTDGRLCGVLDFEKLNWGDPAQDFATLHYFGKEFVVDALQTYASLGGVVEEDFGPRLWKWWQARDFEGLAYAIQQRDRAELIDAMNKIRNGPILG